MFRFGDEVVVLNNWTLTFDSRGIVIKIFKFYAKRTVMKAGTVIRSPLRGFRFSISGTGVIRLTTRHPTPAFVQIPRPPPASDRLDAHQIFEFFFGGGGKHFGGKRMVVHANDESTRFSLKSKK